MEEDIYVGEGGIEVMLTGYTGIYEDGEGRSLTYKPCSFFDGEGESGIYS